MGGRWITDILADNDPDDYFPYTTVRIQKTQSFVLVK
jgi:hypothetical protein